MNNRFSWFNVTAIVVGFAFLYIPILLLVIYSFNESKLCFPPPSRRSSARWRRLFSCGWGDSGGGRCFRG